MSKSKFFIVATVLLLVIGTSSQQALGYYGSAPQSSANNFTVEINTDKESYNTGEPIIFSGSVNKYDQDRTLKITIFNSNQALVLNQKVTVNSDATFSYELMPNEKLLEGKYIVRAQYGTTDITVEKFSFVINSSQDTPEEQISLGETKVPDWIKNNAGWWAAGQIDDNSFVQGIQFLIAEGLMKIPTTEQGSISQNNEIPSWIKNNAGWWAAGQIDDNSFVQGIQFLIAEGLMKISQ